MKLLFARNHLTVYPERSVFLAGPTPPNGSMENTWRRKVVSRLEADYNTTSDVTIVLPEPATGNWSDILVPNTDEHRGPMDFGSVVTIQVDKRASRFQRLGARSTMLLRRSMVRLRSLEILTRAMANPRCHKMNLKLRNLIHANPKVLLLRRQHQKPKSRSLTSTLAY